MKFTEKLYRLLIDSELAFQYLLQNKICKGKSNVSDTAVDFLRSNIDSRSVFHSDMSLIPLKT